MEEENKEIIEPYEILNILRDPQRVSILKALNRIGEMTFTDLMKRVDLPSGRLAFQLSKLEPLLIKTDEKKYRLSSIGYDSLQVVDFSEALLHVPDEHQYKGNITVRKAYLDDAEAIAAIQRSWHEKWYKMYDGRIYEVDLKDLNKEEIEMQVGFGTSEAVKKFLTKTHGYATGHEGPVYVAIVDQRLVGYVVFHWGCVNEPHPWGKRVPFSINLHKDYVDFDIGKALIQTALEIGHKLQANKVELMTMPYFQLEVNHILEKILEEYPNVVKNEYSRLIANVDDLPSKHEALIQRGDSDTSLCMQLLRNRSITYAAQPSYSAIKDYPINPDKGDVLITLGDKTCALSPFKDEEYLNVVFLELYCEPEDWTNKRFVQEVVKAGVIVVKELGNNKVILHIEKQIEPWFIELGFKRWKPETSGEQSRVATPNYLLEV